MAIRQNAELMYAHIEHVVGRAQRDLRRPVYPWEVQGRLMVSRHEGSLRRYMLDMYKMGRLVRVGGYGARQGYRLPTRLERLAWTLNAGLWPYGTEQIRLA